MISTNNVTLQYGKRALFEDVSIKFTPGNCYGLIGANGAGKSTFLKILSGEIEPTQGEVAITPGERLAVLEQDHFAFDEYNVLKTVIRGHRRLYDVMEEKEAIYAKPDFSEEDGMRAAELEGEFAELNGWEADAQAAEMLNSLGIDDDLQAKTMKELTGHQKVRVLLAQALFGNPDILLLDEPTNDLDRASIQWLEEFLYEYENTVIVVSHDRHFLNKVCTHIADIDYGKIQLFVGNYDFWYESTQLAQEMAKKQNKKVEERRKELKAFIERFSSNASKAKQATSRKKELQQLTLEDIHTSSRKAPFIEFKPERQGGKDILSVKNLSKEINGQELLNDVQFMVNRGDKIAFVGPQEQATTTLFQILMGETAPDSGEYHWGITTSQAYFPKENDAYFDVDLTLVDWLRQYSPDPDETFVRGFLGRMLFSGEESLKKANVLSGGEKVRCMLSKMMMSNANVLILDEPTNHLDLESITALNKGLEKFNETILFTSRDHQLVQTVANRIIEITPNGLVDRTTTYDEYLADETIAR